MSRTARRIVASRPGRAVAVRVVLSRDLAGDAPVPGASLTATIDVGDPRHGPRHRRHAKDGLRLGTAAWRRDH